MWHATIYVYIFAYHRSPPCAICFVSSLTKIRLNSIRNLHFTGTEPYSNYVTTYLPHITSVKPRPPWHLSYWARATCSDAWWTRVIYFIVALLTKMVHRYWSKFSHVLFAIITYVTGWLCQWAHAQLCLHIMSHMWHYNVTYATLYVNKSGHTLIGWGTSVGVASHSQRDVIMSGCNCHIVSFRASKM